MTKFKPGDKIIIDTNQVGTLWYINGDEYVVLLANKDIWYGESSKMRHPYEGEDTSAYPLDVKDRFDPSNGRNYKRKSR